MLLKIPSLPALGNASHIVGLLTVAAGKRRKTQSALGIYTVPCAYAYASSENQVISDRSVRRSCLRGLHACQIALLSTDPSS